MSQKVILRGAVSLALIVVCATFAWFRFFYTPGYSSGMLHDGSNIYLINPQTILAALDEGKTDVFLPAPSEPEEGWPQLWPPGSFDWDQGDYLKIANALHQLVWDESLEDWHLIRASFLIGQCRDIYSRIDFAELSFHQRGEDQNGVHGFWINPLHGYVEAGIEYSAYTSRVTYADMPWTPRWKEIELDKVEIRDVNAALAVAEGNGGRVARWSVRGECRITLLLAPDGFEYDFLSHPFTHHGWGWSVIYWPSQSNADPIFGIIIDPYTGKYRILTPAR